MAAKRKQTTTKDTGTVSTATAEPAELDEGADSGDRSGTGMVTIDGVRYRSEDAARAKKRNAQNKSRTAATK